MYDDSPVCKQSSRCSSVSPDSYLNFFIFMVESNVESILSYTLPCSRMEIVFSIIFQKFYSYIWDFSIISFWRSKISSSYCSYDSYMKYNGNSSIIFTWQIKELIKEKKKKTAKDQLNSLSPIISFRFGNYLEIFHLRYRFALNVFIKPILAICVSFPSSLKFKELNFPMTFVRKQIHHLVRVSSSKSASLALTYFFIYSI